MWPYWLMFSLAAVGACSPFDLPRSLRASVWFSVIGFCALLVGLRDEVGADWSTYGEHFDFIAAMTFREAVEFSDPSYYAINWLVNQAGGDIHWVNMVCAVLVMAGVSVFAKSQPLPWLALVVSIPYFIIAVAMGYTRQGAALGLVLIGLAALARGKTLHFVVWVVAGALFHKSAVLVLPIAIVAGTKRRIWTATWVAVTTGLGALLLVLDESEQLWANYVEAEMQSEGGIIRVAMNTVPAVLFLLFGRRLGLETGERRLWWWMSVFALACVPLIAVSSTAVDRVALYFIPVQVFLFSRVRALGGEWLVWGTVGYYGAVLWVWLNYASHSFLWIPYNLMKFGA